MAICNSTQIIAPTECIGDSLVKINNNFSNLNNDVCSLLTLVNELSSNMMTLNVPYVRIAELVPYVRTAGGVFGHVYGPAPRGNDPDTRDYGRLYNVIEEQRQMTPVLAFGQLLLQPGTYNFRHTSAEIQGSSYWYNGTGSFILTQNSLDYIESIPFMIKWHSGDDNVSNSFEGSFSLNTPSTIGTVISVAKAYYGAGGDIIVSGGGRGNATFVASRLELWKIA